LWRKRSNNKGESLKSITIKQLGKLGVEKIGHRNRIIQKGRNLKPGKSPRKSVNVHNIKNEINMWLSTLGLERYGNNFKEKYITLESLKSMDESQMDIMLNEIGCTGGAIIKIKKSIQSLKGSFPPNVKTEFFELGQWLIDTRDMNRNWKPTGNGQIYDLSNYYKRSVAKAKNDILTKIRNGEKVPRISYVFSNSSKMWFKIELEAKNPTVEDSYLAVETFHSAMDPWWKPEESEKGLDFTNKFHVSGRLNLSDALTKIKKSSSIPPTVYIKCAHNQNYTYYKVQTIYAKTKLTCRRMLSHWLPDQTYQQVQIHLGYSAEPTSVENILAIIMQRIKAGESFPNTFYIKGNYQVFYQEFFTLKKQKLRINVVNSPMPENWKPTKYHKNLTKQFSKRNGTCSVMDSLYKINLYLLEKSKLPEIFYLRSTSQQRFFKIEIQSVPL